MSLVNLLVFECSSVGLVENEDIVDRVEDNVVARDEAPVRHEGQEKQVEDVRAEENQPRLVTCTVARRLPYWTESRVNMYRFLRQLCAIL